jgi:sulfur-oxidizing protein SoxY
MNAASPARRRQFLRDCGTLVLLAFAPLRALAAQWNKSAFEAKAVAESLKYIGADSIADSDQIVLKAPEIAENGAIVPLEITSRIPGTQTIYIFAERNPQPLAASFDFVDGIEPFVATRIKMNESSPLRVVVKAGGKFYGTVREVKVTIGGCGA